MDSVLLVANRTLKGFPGMKGVRGLPGPIGYDGLFGMKGGKLSVIWLLNVWFDIFLTC